MYKIFEFYLYSNFNNEPCFALNEFKQRSFNSFCEIFGQTHKDIYILNYHFYAFNMIVELATSVVDT